MNIVKQNIESLNEQEITDAIFALKRFSNNMSASTFAAPDIEKLKNRVSALNQEKRFNSRQLCQIYQGYSNLGWPTDFLALTLSSMIRENPECLNIINIIQILSSGTLKVGYAGISDLILYEEVCKILERNINSIDYSKKADAFQLLAKLEFQYNPPKFTLPSVVGKLRTDLKENIDKLGEDEVISIFEAYNYLPKNYFADLVEELRQMIQITLKHNASNLKSEFLLSFLKTQTGQRRLNRSAQESVNQVFTHIGMRLPSDAFLRKSLTSLISAAEDLSPDSQTFVTAVANIAKADPELIEKNLIVFEYLLKKKVNVTDMLAKMLSSENFSSSSGNRLRRLKNALQYRDEKLYGGKQLLEQIEKHPNYNQLNPGLAKQMIGLFYSGDTENGLAMAEKILQGKTAQDLRSSDFSDLLDVCVSMKVAASISSKKENNILSNLPPYKFNQFFDAFAEISEPTLGQSLLFINVLEMNKDSLQFNKLVSLLLSKRNYLSDLQIKNEQLCTRLINVLSSISSENKQAKIHTLFSLAYRFNENGLYNSRLIYTLQEAYSAIVSENKKINYVIEFQIINLLIENGSLRQDLALKFFDKQNSQGHRIPPALINILLLNRKLDATKKAEVEEAARKIADNYQKRLTDSEPRSAIDAVTNLISLPMQFIKTHTPLIAELLKTHSGSFGQRNFLDLLRAVPKSNIRFDFDSYLPILREMSTIFSTIGPKFRPSEITEAVELFSDFGLKNNNHVNLLLQETGRVFNYLKTSDYVSIIGSFAELGVKQTDLFDKAVEKIIAEDDLSQSELEMLIRSFWQVGYDSESIKTKITPLLDRKGLSLNVFQALVPYVLSLDLKNEQELLDNIFGKIYQKQQPVSPTNSFSITLRLLEELYPNKDYAKVWQEKHDPSVSKLELLKPNRSVIVSSYLEAMSVPFKVDHSLSNLQTSTYLPDQKLILNQIHPTQMNYDRFTYKGAFKLYRRLLELLAKKENTRVVHLSLTEFYQKGEDLSKVQFLVSSGVQAPSTPSYDFSKVVRKDSRPSAESDKQTEVEENKKQERKKTRARAETEGENTENSTVAKKRKESLQRNNRLLILHN